MRRRVLLFCGLALLLAAAGYLVAQRWSGSSPEAPRRTATAVTAPAPRTTSAAGDASPPAAAEEEVVVLEVLGKVERRGAGKPWFVAKAGDVLGRQEAIRTGPRARAQLSLGQGSRLAVDHSTELRLREVSPAIHRVQLQQGRVAVDYQERGTRELELQGGDGQVVARAKAAQFAMLQSGRTVAVATETGTVDLEAGEQVVKVKAGEQSVVQADRPPSPPAVLPKDILLKVARLPARLVERLTTVVGRATPGSRVTVAGEAVELDAKGRFEAQVALDPGQNRIAVVTQDAAGRRREELVQLVLTREAPAEPVQVDWGKKPELEVKWKQKGDK